MQSSPNRLLCVLLAVVGIGGISNARDAVAADFIRGEVTGDGSVNIADPILTLNYLFDSAGGNVALCLDAADSNDDGVVNITDPVSVLGSLFAGLGPILPPYPTCGPDPTEDALGCTFALSCASGIEIELGPQLALAGTTSMTIAWQSRVETLGLIEVSPLNGGEPPRQISDPAPVIEHVLEITDLEPGSEYTYSVWHDGVIASTGHRFTTASDDLQARIRFGIFGDSGVGSPLQYLVADRVLSAHCDLVLITGDILYTDVFRGYFQPYKSLIDHIPFYPVLGNHDFGGAFLNFVYLPVNNVTGTEEFFSFDRGNVHVIAIDSNQSTNAVGTQYKWLENDLANTDAQWIFAYFHFPFYSTLGRASRQLRDDVRPLFDLYNVDIAFAGHDHNYQRTFPMCEDSVVDRESEPDYVDPSGTIYIVTGGGGQRLYRLGESLESTAHQVMVHHFTQVDVQGSHVTVAAVAADGSVADRITITKTVP